MGWIGDQIDSVKSMHFRQLFTQAISLGMIVTSALIIWKGLMCVTGSESPVVVVLSGTLIIWKGLMCVTGSESPVVVVLSGSMEPGFKRGDILFLHMSKDPIRAGEIVVFNVDGREIPIVHRVIKVHEHENGEVDVLTKGDNNFGDDRLLYAQGQMWLQRHHIMGRAVGFLPYVGWVTIIMTEQPIIKIAQWLYPSSSKIQLNQPNFHVVSSAKNLVPLTILASSLLKSMIMTLNLMIIPHKSSGSNRNDPVRLDATLNLTSSGDLILQDFDGSTVWTTNTSGKSVAGMNLTDTGNLVSCAN
ncbi:peptidase S24/S26A/S26B/S26C family protein [Artemisia annua]|uniref:Signal peptidase complex catalytic subunit SEC11 n=1 Tax=Artemisia annua TaxID=35608 RepID=A0A2U1PGR3_ARTAN|nr:peptidase S24/S26A/S26B/S26C family protein [Artemisia annua]